MAATFKIWLISEERRVVDPAVQAQYEREFLRQLDLLLGRVQSPELRSVLQDMKTCPIRDSAGNCYSFVGWILNSLMRHGCGARIDTDAALNYIAFRLLSPVGERGNPRSTVFDFDESRPWTPGTNPLEGRFKTFVLRDVRTLCGKNPSQAFKNTKRPAGTVSIGQRGQKDDDIAGTVSPDEIPAARSTHESELVADIVALLKKRSTPNLPLVAVFQAILNGASLRDQRARFGHSAADAARKIIKQTIRTYAVQTQNQQLLGLMDGQRQPKRPKVSKKPKPVVHHDPDIRDRLSLIDTLDKAGGEGSMALFGRKRRNWLNYAPRDPNSPHRNRLLDVLTRMVEDGVLTKRGTKYMPGPNYARFRAEHGVPANESFVLATAI
jgi:hypothetical protein